MYFLKQPVFFPANYGRVVRFPETAPKKLVVAPDQPLAKTEMFPQIVFRFVLKRTVCVVFQGQFWFFGFNGDPMKRLKFDNPGNRLDQEDNHDHYRTKNNILWKCFLMVES